MQATQVDNQSRFVRNLNRTEFYIGKDDKSFYSELKKISLEKVYGKRKRYLNIACSFDIETTSFTRYNSILDLDEKCAIMYEWTFGINGLVIIGRTWSQFLDLYQNIIKIFDINLQNRIIIYVHNLAYEFQFMRKWFEWSNVFSLKSRKPCYATTIDGVEFRCSYILSGYSLEKLAEQCVHYPCKKMVGDLDYKLLRTSKTPLTTAEIGYCINDVKVVMCYIMEKILSDGNIAKIPLTKTGYVRNFCREKCMYEAKSHKKGGWKFLKYRKLMNSLTLDKEEYLMLKEAFAGGFTHANSFASGKLMENVTSYDFTSSYPAVICSEQFPMSRSETIQVDSMEDLEYNLEHYCCLFEVCFENIHSTELYEHYISKSKTYGLQNAVIDNGRIVSADSLRMIITEVDFAIIKSLYSWDSLSIGKFRRYQKGFLPKDFIESVLTLYQKKTELKDVDGMESEYMNSKEMLNACYGMMVTDIVREEILYEDTEWGENTPDIDTAIEKYNHSVRRFLYYPWGIWVTAYARRNLFTGILEFKHDYIYSDTDSVKVLNADKHLDYIKNYNNWVSEKLRFVLDFHSLDNNLTHPKTIKGKEKPLGIWDFDGKYSKFKTIGAKRYMVTKEDTNQLSITVSGLNKKIAVPYILNIYFSDIAKNVINPKIVVRNPYDFFSDGMFIPAEYTGKNTHTYIDDEREGKLKDYLGVTADYYEKSAVHLEAAYYDLSISEEYCQFLRGLQPIE